MAVQANKTNEDTRVLYVVRAKKANAVMDVSFYWAVNIQYSNVFKSITDSAS